tara:strand:- start:172 stop:336 length:165 start_codon:yes stop_codon:yes gene_type:complete
MNLASAILFFIWVVIVVFACGAWVLRTVFDQLELEWDLEMVDDDEDQFESSDLL